MINKILFSMLAIGIFSSCSNNSEEIILTNIAESLDSPIEITPGIISTGSNLLKAQSVENPHIEFTLQKSPSIFYSNENELQQTYSAVIGKSIAEGEYKIIPFTQESVFSLEENDSGQLTIFENENPVLSYNFGMQLQEGVSERYRRSTYIHPIYDFKRNVLTDDFPSDHYHHRGLSWMWPKIFVDSARYDLWHIYGQQGELNGIHQVFEKWIMQEVGPVCATIGAKNIWQLDNGKKSWMNGYT